MPKMKMCKCILLMSVAALGGSHAVGGDSWVALDAVPYVEPGSAADCSSWVRLEAPAGKYGYAKAVDDGFEFERRPGVRQRFLGACVIGDAVVPTNDAASAAFAAMIPRLGWNAVRIHQHEMSLVGPDGYSLAPDKMRRFDRFFADLIAQGVYITTDLYVTRKVPGRTLQEFKESILFDENSFSNYLGWAKSFMLHRNAFTGRTYAEEPALFSIALINEGNVGNEFRPDRPDGWERVAAEAERRFVRRMRTILRDELGCRALISDFSGWTFKPEYEPVIRDEYDYYDFHGYNDHPIYVGKKFTLPSRMRARPLSAYFGILDKSEMRRRLLPQKPSMMTEWSWSAPGHYRYAGGLVQAVYMARRGVDGLFHYAWGSFASAGDPFGVPTVRARPISYWDMSRDPLALASERAVSALYLRGDLTPDSTFTNDVQRDSFAVTTPATVGRADAACALWQTSCDGRPLAETGRILVTHLTDLVNTGMKMEDWEGNPTLLTKWGTLPYLLRRHVVQVDLKVRPGSWHVYRLETTGRRRNEVGCRYADGVLRFMADNGADPANATILYEAVDAGL